VTYPSDLAIAEALLSAAGDLRPWSARRLHWSASQRTVRRRLAADPLPERPLRHHPAAGLCPPPAAGHQPQPTESERATSRDGVLGRWGRFLAGLPKERRENLPPGAPAPPLLLTVT
jgi:hypothetical protein